MAGKNQTPLLFRITILSLIFYRYKQPSLVVLGLLVR